MWWITCWKPGLTWISMQALCINNIKERNKCIHTKVLTQTITRTNWTFFVMLKNWHFSILLNVTVRSSYSTLQNEKIGRKQWLYKPWIWRRQKLLLHTVFQTVSNIYQIQFNVTYHCRFCRFRNYCGQWDASS